MNEAVPSPPAVGIPDAAEAEAEIFHIRLAVSRAYQALRQLAMQGGDGADGHLWQRHAQIADDLFAESVWMKRHDREFVTREEYDALFNADQKRSFEIRLLCDAIAVLNTQAIEARRAATIGAVHESAVPQECAETEVPNDRNS